MGRRSFPGRSTGQVNLPHYRVRAATATRYLFFTGKGGVGKTSLACATALKLAEAGKRVLLASTDPASNLDEVLEITLSNKSTAVPGVAGLLALNINPAEAAAAYRERVVGPMRGLLPEAALRRMEEQLSGSCTVEPAAFDEFSGLIGDKNAGRELDHIIFDTAPTGHLLLLDASEAYNRERQRQTRRTQPESVLRLLERLRDPAFTRIRLVTVPQATPVHEAADLQEDLRRAHIEPFAWVINQSLLQSGSCDPLLQRREAAEHHYLCEVVEQHATRAAWLPWQAEEPIGPDALARLAASSLGPAVSHT